LRGSATITCWVLTGILDKLTAKFGKIKSKFTQLSGSRTLQT